MASAANACSPSFSAANSSVSKPKALSDFYLRFRNINALSLRSKRVGLPVLSFSRIRSPRISASSPQVMDQSVGEASSKAPTIVEVDLGNRSYPIYIGSGLLDQPELLQRYGF